MGLSQTPEHLVSIVERRVMDIGSCNVRSCESREPTWEEKVASGATVFEVEVPGGFAFRLCRDHLTLFGIEMRAVLGERLKEGSQT